MNEVSLLRNKKERGKSYEAKQLNYNNLQAALFNFFINLPIEPGFKALNFLATNNNFVVGAITKL